ncbi:MAG TPA: aminotransferase class V-fold PLP-dependent enzyme [Acidimicrobiia bacterium]|nr:aminotransferase class V-fold PLP-dependent enzyme [Acidimicrobiia bacterium]
MLEPRRQVLFNPGPVNLDPVIHRNLFNVELCHREPEFDRLAARIRSRLAAQCGFDPESFELSLLHGSGTLAVDAALATLVRGRVLVPNNGLYCQRLLDTLARFDGTATIDHHLGFGAPIDLDELDGLLRGEQPDWLAVVHHETTTGLLNPLEEIATQCAAHGVRLFVDAVSSLGAHAVDPRADVVCFNSSKCLESLPGIAGVFWRSELALHRTVPVLDVGAYAHGMASTPNVQAYVALDIALDLLAAEDRPGRYARLARHVWEAGSVTFEPFLPEAQRSHVLTAFRLGGRTIDDLFARAYEHGFVIYPGQAKLRDEIFRVANMGALIDEPTIDSLFAVLAA